jgi:hypothetical protein
MLYQASVLKVPRRWFMLSPLLFLCCPPPHVIHNYMGMVKQTLPTDVLFCLSHLFLVLNCDSGVFRQLDSYSKWIRTSFLSEMEPYIFS